MTEYLDKSGLEHYTEKVKEKLADKVTKPGNDESTAEPYKFRCNIDSVSQNADSIMITYKTITLDNNKTVSTHTTTIPVYTGTNAGLYNKTLADAKSKVSVAASGTSTTEVKYITIDGLEYKLVGTGGGSSVTVIDNLTSTSRVDALSANQGRVLSNLIKEVSSVGRCVSTWSCVNGKPAIEPASVPFYYQAGDYYLVSSVGTGSTTNYKPDGASYTGAASVTPETLDVQLGDMYLYNGLSWSLVALSNRYTAFKSLVGDARDNESLATEFGNIDTALSERQKISTLETDVAAKGFSKVSVAGTGTATDVVNYITIDGTQKMIGGYKTTVTNNLTSDSTTNALSAKQGKVLAGKLTDGSVTKVGTTDVGSATHPIYLKEGVPTATSGSVGGVLKPIYLKDGVPTAGTQLYSKSQTINGTERTGIVRTSDENLPSIYAPTGPGTSGQLLQSTAGVPGWCNLALNDVTITYDSDDDTVDLTGKRLDIGKMHVYLLHVELANTYPDGYEKKVMHNVRIDGKKLKNLLGMSVPFTMFNYDYADRGYKSAMYIHHTSDTMWWFSEVKGYNGGGNATFIATW